MNNSKVISVLGCGWLGFPLAKELTEKGFFVRGATTTPDKLVLLKAAGVDPFLVHFTPRLQSSTDEVFFNCDVLFVNIPPKGDIKNFIAQVREIIELIKNHKIKKVIFISSTSVYGDMNKEVNEDDITIPETDSGKALLKAEQLFFEVPNLESAIIRFGGLVGPGRHPGRFLAGKKDIPNGKAPVNLIHLEDCIEIIAQIIEKNSWGKTFNACSPDHLSRQGFYELAAQKGGFEKPQFKDELLNWKIINSKNLSSCLNYRFKIKDWKLWLEELI